ncbi:MAG: NUDIX domain-containing protein [Planctomycetes bacterium]|nr:NUDIX domain-containing protein [Planctomycetota bacterium]
MLTKVPARGGWTGVVTGKVEPSDPSPAAAAARELAEETGVECDAERLTPIPGTQDFTALDGTPYREHVFVFAVESDAVRLSPEHASYRWLAPAAARAAFTFDGTRAILDRALALLRQPRRRPSARGQGRSRSVISNRTATGVTRP